jgi:hypothetical protein
MFARYEALGCPIDREKFDIGPIRAEVRNLLEDMREPSEAMMRVERLKDSEGHSWILRGERLIWQAMIDAAISEESAADKYEAYRLPPAMWRAVYMGGVDVKPDFNPCVAPEPPGFRVFQEITQSPPPEWKRLLQPRKFRRQVCGCTLVEGSGRCLSCRALPGESGQTEIIECRT